MYATVENARVLGNWARRRIGMQLVICLAAFENIGNYYVPGTFLMKCLLENQSCLSGSKAETVSLAKWDLVTLLA